MSRCESSRGVWSRTSAPDPRHHLSYVAALTLSKPSEKNLIVNFALYWSQKRGGPLCMGGPAAQIVVHTLMELGQTWEGEFCKVEQREDVAVY